MPEGDRPGWLGGLFDATTRRILAVAGIIGLIGAVWQMADTRWVKTDELQEVGTRLSRVEAFQQKLRLELRVGQLEGQRGVLRSELRGLTANGARTARERARREAVADELRDVDREIDRLQTLLEVQP